MGRFPLILIWALLTSCGIYNRDLTAISPYSEYAKGPVTLKKAMVLVEDRASYRPYAKLALVKPGYPFYAGAEIKSLPRGSRIRIERVHWVNAIDSAWVTAVGRTEDNLEFEFRVGGYGSKLPQQPWEDRPRPQPCRIGWEGKINTDLPPGIELQPGP